MALRAPKRLAPHQGHRLITGPTGYPVTMQEMLQLLRDPPDDEYLFIAECVKEATRLFEGLTGIACLNQTWRLTLDNWPGGGERWWDGYRQLPVTELQRGEQDYVVLPRYPLGSVSAVTTYDLSGVATSVTVADVFFTDSASFPGRLVLQPGQTWPIALRDRNAIEITYVAGFGATAADVPEPVRRAIRQVAAYLFDNRGSGCSPEKIISSTGVLQIASEYVTVRL